MSENGDYGVEGISSPTDSIKTADKTLSSE
jgi:hypothetical protein